jgi:DNA-directed RNA polymerase alpha subunit
MAKDALKVSHDSYGDANQFPSLISLSNIVNEMEYDAKRKSHRYISSTIQEMHITYRSISCLENKTRAYICELIKCDILVKIDTSAIPEIAKTHLKNYIFGYYRLYVKTFIH